MEATFSLLAGVCSLLIFTAPVILFGFFLWGCRLMYSEDHCSHFNAVAIYLRELLLYHLVYQSVLYACRSREFSSTLRQKWKCCFCCASPELSVRGGPVVPTPSFVQDLELNR